MIKPSSTILRGNADFFVDGSVITHALLNVVLHAVVCYIEDVQKMNEGLKKSRLIFCFGY